MWNMVLIENNWTVPLLRDMRYDQVIHLVTAAVGAEVHYTKANNAARRETPSEAAELDSKVLEAYIGHPRLSIVDNRTDFGQKMDRTLQHMFDLVGIEHGAKKIIYKRYRIKKHSKQVKYHSALPYNSQQLIDLFFHDHAFDTFKFPNNLHYADITIEKTFLTPLKDDVVVDREKISNDNVPDRSYIYRRGQAGSYQYFLRKVGTRKPNLIDVKEFLSHLERSDPEMAILYERVRYFIYKYQYFALIDVGNEQFLEVGVDSMTAHTVEFPPFIAEQGSIELAEETWSQKWEIFDAWLATELQKNESAKNND
jgi:hypothetical protein